MRCPVTGLTDQEKLVLRQSWAMLKSNPNKESQSLGSDLVLWMFDNIPHMRALLTSNFYGKEPPRHLVADDKFLSHSKAILTTIDYITKVLDRPPELQRKFQTLVKIHLSQDPSVGSVYFEIFASRFHLFLETALRVRPPQIVVAVWEKLFSSLTAVIKAEEGAIRQSRVGSISKEAATRKKCPVTGMTYEEKERVQESWASLKKDSKYLGIDLILWMFDNIPHMRLLFSGKFDATAVRNSLVEDDKFIVHTQAVICTFDLIIKKMDDPKFLRERILLVVKFHVNREPSIGSVYFEIFASRFHLFLETALEKRASIDDIAAWEKFLYALAAAIKSQEREKKDVKSKPIKNRRSCCLIL